MVNWTALRIRISSESYSNKIKKKKTGKKKCFLVNSNLAKLKWLGFFELDKETNVHFGKHNKK